MLDAIRSALGTGWLTSATGSLKRGDAGGGTPAIEETPRVMPEETPADDMGLSPTVQDKLARFLASGSAPASKASLALNEQAGLDGRRNYGTPGRGG